MESEVIVERIAFRGHPLISALHPTTIEVTTESHLTKNGDCIVGVGADRGCYGLGGPVKAALKRGGALVSFRLAVGPESFSVAARGDPRLTLSHPRDIVLRKSEFISDRTVAIGANFAARDIPRRMVERLRSPKAVGILELEVL